MECNICLQESPTHAHYRCTHSNCFICYNDLMKRNVTSCPSCRQAMQLVWISGTTQVFVRTHNRTAVLWVDLSHTTWQCVTNMMIAKWELDWRPRLILHGKSCFLDRTLESSGCKASDTVHIFISLSGD